MTFESARLLESEAETIAKCFENINGVKPWYSHASLFDGPAKRVFIGLNPGGSSKAKELDAKYLGAVYEIPNFSSWLDEEWEKRGGGVYPAGTNPHQENTHKAFQAMYGENWENVLRNTACFNVIPFRTPSGETLPAGAWDAAQPWFQKVIKHLQPTLIICNGSGETRPDPENPSKRKSPSAWGALKEFKTIYNEKRINTTRSSSIKYGSVTLDTNKSAYVVALPHLSKRYFWPTDSQFDKLRQLRKKQSDLFV